jgi:hypothetical protein
MKAKKNAALIRLSTDECDLILKAFSGTLDDSREDVLRGVEDLMHRIGSCREAGHARDKAARIERDLSGA